MRRTLASHALRGLRSAVGRPGPVAPQLPLGLAWSIASERAVELLRGLLRTRARVFLAPGVRFRGKRRIRLGPWSSIGRSSQIDGYSVHGVHLGPASRLGGHCVVTVTSHVGRIGQGFRLGARSGLGDFCHVGASGGVVIGDDVICGSYVSFHAQEHVFDDPDRPIRDQGVTESGITVGDGCWLGARVTVLDGTVIGAGSVVAAGAVVKGVFPPRSLVGGIPARVIRSLGAN